MSKVLNTPHSWFGPLLLIGGGAAVGTAAIFAYRKSVKTTEDVQNAVAGATPPPQLEMPPSVATEESPTFRPPMQAGTGGYVKLRTTGYWPSDAKTEAERQMEGGPKGAARWRDKTDPRVINPALDPSTGKRVALITVEMYRANPAQYPYVSLSGDYNVWPWGQKIVIPWVDGGTIIGRVVDTGSHFHGVNKVYRVAGYEPIDVCVNSRDTKVPTKVTAQIIVGDNWERGIGIAAGNLRGQTITGFSPAGIAMTDGRGYGPYGNGYLSSSSGFGGYVPFGPRGESLSSSDYDFQPGPGGDFLRGKQRPIALADGVEWADDQGNYGPIVGNPATNLRGAVVDGFTVDDHEALARAIESELGDRSVAEQRAAGWAMRNRAAVKRTSLKSMLAPRGYGSPKKSGGYASTRKVPTEKSKKVVEEVLGSAGGDPTDGATEFWAPEQQTRLNQLGDVYRASAQNGDQAKAKKYQRYAGYGTEGDVRLQHAMDGLQIRRIVGIIELLGKVNDDA